MDPHSSGMESEGTEWHCSFAALRTAKALGERAHSKFSPSHRACPRARPLPLCGRGGAS